MQHNATKIFLPLKQLPILVCRDFAKAQRAWLVRRQELIGTRIECSPGVSTVRAGSDVAPTTRTPLNLPCSERLDSKLEQNSWSASWLGQGLLASPLRAWMQWMQGEDMTEILDANAKFLWRDLARISVLRLSNGHLPRFNSRPND